MSDIVKRLRTTASQYMTSNYSERLMHEAADEIERLRAEYEDEIDLKRAALDGTSKLMGAEIERLREELAAAKALLREAMKAISFDDHPNMALQIEAALSSLGWSVQSIRLESKAKNAELYERIRDHLREGWQSEPVQKEPAED